MARCLRTSRLLNRDYAVLFEAPGEPTRQSVYISYLSYMKTSLRLFAVLALAVAFTPFSLRAQDEPQPPPPDAQGDQSDQGDQGASFQTFYDQLGDQGTWVQTDDYGYVFQPNVSDPNWAPYTDGHWVYTDAGWTWVSDEPWGWATYHYGRWANIDGYGWVWVPGYRWAPAWVSWRYGGGYAGWAPLPPDSFVGAEYGGSGGWATFHFGGDVDVSFGIGAGCYNFVSVDDMGEPNYRGHYIDRSRNFTIINNTTNITNININRNGTAGGGANFRGVSVGGPTLNEVNAHSRQHVAKVQLTASNQAGRSTLHGNSLAVFAPAVNPNTARTAKPGRVAQTIAHPTFNRGVSITKPLAVTASVRPPAPSAEAIQAAKTAQAHVPTSARIATAKTKVKAPLTKPLTSMQPVQRTTAPETTQHPAASSPYTGESVKPETTQHAAASSPYTGEAVKPEATQHAAASSPYTGESVKPTATETYHPQAEEKPAATYHPQTEEKPAATYHPQTEEKPAATYHPQAEEKPTATYHPQTEEKPAATYHPQAEEKPAATYHPQAEEKPAPAYHPQPEEKPAPAYHPQAEEKPAPAYHPQAQAAPVHQAAPAPHPQAAPAPAANSAPAPGKPENNGPQGH